MTSASLYQQIIDLPETLIGEILDGQLYTRRVGLPGRHAAARMALTIRGVTFRSALHGPSDDECTPAQRAEPNQCRVPGSPRRDGSLWLHVAPTLARTAFHRAGAALPCGYTEASPGSSFLPSARNSPSGDTCR